MNGRYQATCRVCGEEGHIGPGWCKLIVYEDGGKSTEWLCPKHYKEYLNAGKKVIQSKKKPAATKRGRISKKTGKK